MRWFGVFFEKDLSSVLEMVEAGRARKAFSARHARRAMKTLRQWTQELMAQQFLDGLIVGFLCGALITGAAVRWIQDRSIVRAARADEGNAAEIYSLKGLRELRNEWLSTTGVSILFKSVDAAHAIKFPPDPLMEVEATHPQWQGDAKPGDVRMLCMFYEEKRVTVNPCPRAGFVVPSGVTAPGTTYGR